VDSSTIVFKSASAAGATMPEQFQEHFSMPERPPDIQPWIWPRHAVCNEALDRTERKSAQVPCRAVRVEDLRCRLDDLNLLDSADPIPAFANTTTT
jgi:hypothetical protein